MILRTHASVSLRGGLLRLDAEYQAADGVPGTLSLRLEGLDGRRPASGSLRLDPWIADEYSLLEFAAGECFVLAGAQAIVAIGVEDLQLRSSLSLAFEEGESIDSPWHVAVEDRRQLVLATEQRVWCIDRHGAIRWVWACADGAGRRRVCKSLSVAGDRIRVELATATSDVRVELLLADGLPV